MCLYGRLLLAGAALFTAARLVAGESVAASDNGGIVLPVKIAVLEFTTLDVKGNEFLERPDIKIDIPAMKSLNTADRLSINGVMQGFIGAVDAWDNHTTHAAELDWTIKQRDEEWARWKTIYDRLLNGPTRPVIAGADYLGAYLGSYPETFSCVDNAAVTSALVKLPAAAGYPTDAMRKLGAASGVDFLVYGIVTDLASREKSFKGYGVETKTRIWSLDVIVKLVDLKSQRGVYANVYTATVTEQYPYSPDGIDGNVFQTLMRDALKNAAADIRAKVDALAAPASAVSAAPETTVVSPAAVESAASSSSAPAAGSAAPSSSASAAVESAAVVRPVIAVAETETRGGVKAEDVAGLSSLIETGIDTSSFKLVTRAGLASMLTEIGLGAGSPLLVDGRPRAELGGVLGVGELLVPSVTRIGNRMILTMTLVDATTGEVKKQSGKLTAGNLDGIVTQLDNELRKMGIGRPADGNFAVVVAAPTAAVGLPVQLKLPDFFAGDFVAQMQQVLIGGGIDVLERADRAAVLREMGIADAATAEPDQFASVNQEKVAGYLVLTSISRFELLIEAPKKLVSGTTNERRIRTVEGQVKVIRVRDNKLIATMPFAKRQIETSIPIDLRRDWTERDFDNYLLHAALSDISPVVAKAIAAEKENGGK
ncbi:MAG: hypothetical protein PHI85_02205 [Victivallaceae bacterium]|nr:hypothetical protein [Victivallaceae bacterium]